MRPDCWFEEWRSWDFPSCSRRKFSAVTDDVVLCLQFLSTKKTSRWGRWSPWTSTAGASPPSLNPLRLESVYKVIVSKWQVWLEFWRLSSKWTENYQLFLSVVLSFRIGSFTSWAPQPACQLSQSSSRYFFLWETFWDPLPDRINPLTFYSPEQGPPFSRAGCFYISSPLLDCAFLESRGCFKKIRFFFFFFLLAEEKERKTSGALQGKKGDVTRGYVFSTPQTSSSTL